MRTGERDLETIDGRGDRYVIKLDPIHIPEIATAAEVIATAEPDRSARAVGVPHHEFGVGNQRRRTAGGRHQDILRSPRWQECDESPLGVVPGGFDPDRSSRGVRRP